MLTQMAFLVSVANACGRIVRYHRRKRTQETPDRRPRLMDQPFAFSAMGDSMDVGRTVRRNMGGGHLSRRSHC